MRSMKKVLVSGLLIIVFTVYVLHQKSEEDGVSVSPPTINNQPINSFSATQTTQNAAPTNGYKDGQYTGSVADAYYGNVQVKATIAGGKITDVQFLQYPNDRRTSIEINTQAMPYLKQEAIAAQSANVDIVSGATQTSQAFRESLQSALSKAQ